MAFEKDMSDVVVMSWTESRVLQGLWREGWSAGGVTLRREGWSDVMEISLQWCRGDAMERGLK